MIKTIRRGTGKSHAAIIAAASVFLGQYALAGAVFNSTSTAKVTHDPDTTAATTNSTKNVNPPPASGSMASYQYGNTLTLSGASTLADASIGAVTTSTITGFTLGAGSGVSQDDPAHAIGPSQCKIQFNGIWDITSGGFGPTATGYISFTLAGSVGNPGSATCTVNVTFKDELNNTLRSAISQSYTFGSGQTFSQSFLSNAAFSPSSLGSGKKVIVNGTIDFRADNAGGPSTIKMPDFECSSAPPTSRFLPGAGTQVFNDPANWTSDLVSSGIPNNIGDRAVFVGPQTDEDVAFNQNTTLGTVDIDRPGLNFSGVALGGVLTFQTLAGNAVILSRNVQGDSGHVFDVPVVANSNLEIENDCVGPLTFQQPVSGPGGIIKNGLGAVIFVTPNTYSGGTVINAGQVYANAPGALGSGSVQVNGMMLYNISGPTQPGGSVIVQSGGEALFGPSMTPGGADNIIVQSGGCIAGDTSQLSSLNIGGNLQLAPGAMIAHSGNFDTGPSGNPNGLFPSGPQYLYGIAKNFTGAGPEIITVGSASASPWGGFGGDRGIRVFGNSPNNNNQQLNIAGNASLVSLSSQLTMNAPITGGGPSSVLTKSGSGIVSLNSMLNTYSGALQVAQGPLEVNGAFSASSTGVASGATLGGTGVLNSPVALANGAHLAPGTTDPVNSVGQPYGFSYAGTFHTGGVNLSAASILDWNLDDIDVIGGSNDLLVVNGNLSLSGILHIIDGANFADTGTYTLIQFSGSLLPGANTLSIDPNGPDLGSLHIELIPNPNGGGSVVLTSVPEPTALSLAAVTASFLLARRRR